MTSTRTYLALGTTLLAALGITVACSSSSSSNGATGDAGSSDGSTTTDGSVADAPSSSDGAAQDASPAEDAGCIAEVDAGPAEACVPFDGGTAAGDAGGDAGNSTLYERLGGHACVRSFVTAVVVQSLKDPQLASYFSLNVPCTRPNHPTPKQLIECFTDLIGSAVGGAENYPATAYGWTCRTMAASHANLHIPNDAFTKFVATAVGVASSGGVAPGDVAKIGALLNTTKSDIVDPAAPAGAFFDGG